MLHDDFNNRLKIDRITARRRFERECSEYRKNNTQTYVEQHQEGEVDDAHWCQGRGTSGKSPPSKSFDGWPARPPCALCGRGTFKALLVPLCCSNGAFNTPEIETSHGTRKENCLHESEIREEEVNDLNPSHKWET